MRGVSCSRVPSPSHHQQGVPDVRRIPRRRARPCPACRRHAAPGASQRRPQRQPAVYLGCRTGCATGRQPPPGQGRLRPDGRGGLPGRTRGGPGAAHDDPRCAGIAGQGRARGEGPGHGQCGAGLQPHTRGHERLLRPHPRRLRAGGRAACAVRGGRRGAAHRLPRGDRGHPRGPRLATVATVFLGGVPLLTRPPRRTR